MDIIFETLAGSNLYGTNTPLSDKDYRGVCLQPIDSLIGLQPFEQYEIKKPDDRTIYGLNKFIILAKDCNPNIVEILFAPTSGSTNIVMTDTWKKILEIKEAFISKKAKHTFSGYAYAQLARIKTHYEYMTGKIPDNVTPEEFGGYKNDKGNFVWPSGIEQNTYSNAHNKYTNYLSWLKNRNPIRHELEEKYKYDTKHGLHLVRLISEGEELLRDHKITLPRPDAKFLLEILNGRFTYEEIVEYAEAGDKRLQEIHDNCTLPFSSDFNTIHEVVKKINLATIKNYIYYIGDSE